MNIQKNILLAPLTTFKTGGLAKAFCEANTKEELSDCVAWAKNEKLNIFCLGGGSNLLINDSGFDGLVIKITNNRIKWEGGTSFCGAGILLVQLINEAKARGLGGMEWAYSIPATLGGATRNNAGAFGSDISKHLDSVEFFDTGKGAFAILQNKECLFSYRNSVFHNKPGWIIWEIKITWEKKPKEVCVEEIRNFLEQRKSKQPLELPSAGSFFRNPSISKLNEVKKNKLIEEFVKSELDKLENGDKNAAERKIREKIIQDETLPAGYFIEKANLKERSIGGAQVSNKHANFIVNTGGAKTEDVVMLASIIKQKVRTKFGVQLHEEVKYVGF
ncbi:MAG: UDP-N-acetylmuramate dehydrogenase [Candidatus Moraniibacteriota bacterium]